MDQLQQTIQTFIQKYQDYSTVPACYIVEDLQILDKLCKTILFQPTPPLSVLPQNPQGIYMETIEEIHAEYERVIGPVPNRFKYNQVRLKSRIKEGA